MELVRSNLAMTLLVASTVAMFGMVVVFMVAAWWLRRANDRKAARWAVLEARWRALLEAIENGTLAQEELHAQVSASERMVLVDFLYKHAVSETREERKQLCRRLAVPYLGVVAARVETGDVWQRARAVRTLAELAGPAHSSAIVDALDDESGHVAQTAARAYARLRLGPIEALLQRLDRYDTWDRRLLRQTLASAGPSAKPALLASLADRTLPPGVRVICADALAALHTQGANEVAMQVVMEESDVELRAAALRLFRGELTEQQRDVVRGLCQVDDPILQGQAVACLARLGDPRDRAELERALDHASPWVRFNAARGLKHRGAAEPALAGAGSSGQE